jgi:hypothetical protein
MDVALVHPFALALLPDEEWDALAERNVACCVWGALTRSSGWEADLGRSSEIGRRGQGDATINL